MMTVPSAPSRTANAFAAFIISSPVLYVDVYFTSSVLVMKLCVPNAASTLLLHVSAIP